MIYRDKALGKKNIGTTCTLRVCIQSHVYKRNTEHAHFIKTSFSPTSFPSVYSKKYLTAFCLVYNRVGLSLAYNFSWMFYFHFDSALPWPHLLYSLSLWRCCSSVERLLRVSHSSLLKTTVLCPLAVIRPCFSSSFRWPMINKRARAGAVWTELRFSHKLINLSQPFYCRPLPLFPQSLSPAAEALCFLGVLLCKLRLFNKN